MLVLSRKNGQSILIGDQIEIVMVQSNLGRAQIGIQAPAEVQVLRSELADTELVTEPGATAGQEAVGVA